MREQTEASSAPGGAGRPAVLVLVLTLAVVALALGVLPGAQATSDVTVRRFNGANRYETARLVAEEPGKANVGRINGKKVAIVASGENFPDALAGGPMAYASQFPLILTTQATLSPSASQAFTDLGIQHVLVLGGP